jgi:hypothetical protein
MLLVEKMLKAKLSIFGRKMVPMLKNGLSFTKTKKKNSEEKERMKSSTSRSIDHSTSDQECQCRELLNAGEQTMLSFLITFQEEEANNSSSMKHQRLSSHNNGKIDH